MEQFKVPFGISSISISIADNKKEEKFSELKQLLYSRALYLDSLLNEHDTASATYSLNSSGTGMPVSVSSEYLDYLENNLELSSNSNGLFSSFENMEGDATPSPSRYYEIDKKGKKVTKTKEIYFKGNTLLDAFVIEEIAKLLEKEKINNFLVFTETCILARGKDEWQVEIKEPINDEPLTIPMRDRSFCLVVSGNTQAERLTPFTHISEDHKNLAASSEHKDLITAKYLAFVALKLLTADQLHSLATQWESEITVYYPEAHYVFGS